MRAIFQEIANQLQFALGYADTPEQKSIICEKIRKNAEAAKKDEENE